MRNVGVATSPRSGPMPGTYASPEQLLVQSLSAPAETNVWGTVTTTLVGAVSFGILPLLLWPGRLRDAAWAEAHQFRNLVDWIRERGRSPAAVGPLRAAADAVELRSFFTVFPYLIGLAVLACFGFYFFQNGFSIDRLMRVTYDYHHQYRSYHYPWQPPAWLIWGSTEQLHLIWCAGLLLGYVFHFVQVRLHAADVRRFVGRFNRVAVDEGIAPIRWRYGGGIFPLLGIAAAIGFCHYDAWWGIAMIVASLAERRMDRSIGKTIRSELVQRVRLMQPATRTASAERCPQPRCLALLPVGSAFCPRCGSNVAVRGTNQLA